MMGFVTRLIGERREPPEESSATAGRDHRPSARLYECPDCESVYLSRDLETCRSCDTGVESVPTEHDLGFASADGQ